MTIIIPSRNECNLTACLHAIAMNDPEHSVFVVDDGLGGFGTLAFATAVIYGEKPFIFARNVNMGIRAAGDDDVLLLNDDALLETPGGFTAMAESCEKNGFGLLGPRTNSSGNRDQVSRHNIHCPSIHTTKRTVPFLCAFIPRSTINLVGLLDERFTAYGFEDQDYCRRVRAAGLRLGIYDGCFVDHLKLPSTFRGPGGVSGDLEEGRRIYIEKWGDENI